MLGLDSHIASPVSGVMIDREIDEPIAWTRKTLASGEGSARCGIGSCGMGGYVTVTGATLPILILQTLSTIISF